MSEPLPMDCLSDQCRSPMACNAAGECQVRSRQGAREYEEALTACRERNITDPFAKRPEQ